MKQRANFFPSSQRIRREERDKDPMKGVCKAYNKTKKRRRKGEKIVWECYELHCYK